MLFAYWRLQTYVLEELVSPIVTPLILCCSLRNKAAEIVDFYRHFTVEVTGVGDVCSFAQLNVRKHGHPQVRTNVSVGVSTLGVDANKVRDGYQGQGWLPKSVSGGVPISGMCAKVRVVCQDPVSVTKSVKDLCQD